MTAERYERLLRWYPTAWRERYASEFLAMIDDTLEGSRPPLRLRWSLLTSGVREHLRQAGMIGFDRPLTQRRRGGALMVLIGWSMVVVAGCGFAKFNEHWQAGVPSHDRGVADVAYVSMEVLAVVAMVVVVLTAAAAIPALVRSLRRGAWTCIRRPLAVATVLSAIAVASTLCLAAWAHHLNNADRNGHLAAYSVVFVVWGAIMVLTIAAWTAAAIRIEQQLTLTPLLARLESVAALLVAVTTIAITAALITWWVSLALQAPWAIAGTRTHAQLWAWPLGLVAILATAASAVATAGAGRVTSRAELSNL